jgi:hypothetical protein
MANKLHTSWPKGLPTGVITPCKLIWTDTEALPPLNARGWHLVQNPDFNQLILGLGENDIHVARKWLNRLQLLGQTENILLSFDKTDIQLYRPVCTFFTDTEITLHYLHKAVQNSIM